MKYLTAILLALVAAHLVWLVPANALVWVGRGFLTYVDLGVIATASMLTASLLRDRRVEG